MDQPTGVGAVGCSRSGVARGQRALLEADDAVGDVGAQRRCRKDTSTNGPIFAATPEGDGPRPQDSYLLLGAAECV